MTGSSSSIPELCHLPGFHEPFSAISHLIGAVIFFFLSIMLLRRGWGNRERMAYLGVYAFSCVLLFSMSAAFHMPVRGCAVHQVVERLDHAAIFVLVAGTCTPIHGILFHGWLRTGPLLLVWGGAIAGITLKTIFFEDVAEWVGLALYLGLGWLGAFGVTILAWRYGFAFVIPLVLGGVAYSVGGIMDLYRWWVVIPGVLHPHDLFHLMALLGAVLHWQFIWQIARGAPRERMPEA